jgi:hypothetical protein
MRLFCRREALAALPDHKLIEAITERRNAIRTHRDQKGDDRCFLDDYVLWNYLADSEPELTLPGLEQGMQMCTLFWIYRGATSADKTPANANPHQATWDNDLRATGSDHAQLVEILLGLQEAIKAHRNVQGHPRTLKDDRLLYASLPEKMPADFRLPNTDEFLGEAKAPKAGCPSFWRSHGNCPGAKHNLHAWGPCPANPK